ncbi:MAG TPA: hypothetical protein DCQ31_16270 [Bacteroidales bacterium]|nr:hypothetical protein [Bacteroidales bacterium]
MKNNVIKLLAAIIAVTLTVGANAQFKYVGADGCKMCHNKPAKGDQYNTWLNGKHAKAFSLLKTEAEKKDPKCLSCHSTFGSVAAADISGRTFAATEGVSCESCHGPGSAYKAPAVMKDQGIAKSKGMIIPSQSTCDKCHDDAKKPSGHKVLTKRNFVYDAKTQKFDHKTGTVVAR